MRPPVRMLDVPSNTYRQWRVIADSTAARDRFHREKKIPYAMALLTSGSWQLIYYLLSLSRLRCLSYACVSLRRRGSFLNLYGTIIQARYTAYSRKREEPSSSFHLHEMKCVCPVYTKMCACEVAISSRKTGSPIFIYSQTDVAVEEVGRHILEYGNCST